MPNYRRKRAARGTVGRDTREGSGPRTGTLTAAAPLTIPTGPRDDQKLRCTPAKVDRVAKANLYVDTSFLVWLTALGKEARGSSWDGPSERLGGACTCRSGLRTNIFAITWQTFTGRSSMRLPEPAEGSGRGVRDPEAHLDSQIVNDPRSPSRA